MHRRVGKNKSITVARLGSSLTPGNAVSSQEFGVACSSKDDDAWSVFFSKKRKHIPFCASMDCIVSDVVYIEDLFLFHLSKPGTVMAGQSQVMD